MLRGFTNFTCDKCGNKFMGPDMEFSATIWTCPVRCPKCGSKHTYPRTLFGANKVFYKKIWAFLDKH